jgi:tetraprenyl-beta-curcumene synthase
MRTVIHTNNGSAPPPSTESVVVLSGPAQTRGSVAEQLELPLVFAETIMRYLLRVLPCVRSELHRWRARAAQIPDPVLREHAEASLRKEGNIEGAALFATLSPAMHRNCTVRALVAFQSAYSYLDTLSEQPSADPVNNADQMHQALLVALHPTVEHTDYHRHNPQRSDGGYLTAMIDSCRRALSALPSWDMVAPTARSAAARIVDFQALNLSPPHRDRDPLEDWAIEMTPAASRLAWWETAAAGGSSLAVHALIAAAADPRLHAEDVIEIDRAYFPSIGALHSLLDSLVDQREDLEQAQRSLLGYYPTPTTAAIGLSSLALNASKSIESLPNRRAHQVILAAMCSYYLSAPQCNTAEAHTITRSLTRTLGLPVHVAITLFRVRRMAASLMLGSYT